MRIIEYFKCDKCSHDPCDECQAKFNVANPPCEVVCFMTYKTSGIIVYKTSTDIPGNKPFDVRKHKRV